MRKKLIAGNWKMNKTTSEAEILAGELMKVAGSVDYCDVVICPPFTSLDCVVGVVKDSKISVGAQDLHWEDQGAYTGKISGDMIKNLGASHVIIGHSEQRTYFHETNETVNLKTKKALAHGLIPIVCIGETLKERDAGQTEEVVHEQLEGAYKDFTKDEVLKCIVAYEPVWAIGTGKVATPEQAQDVHAYIRKILTNLFDKDLAQEQRILYGGSMKPDNAKGLLEKPDIDGGLIGGASLKAESFMGIIEATR